MPVGNSGAAHPGGVTGAGQGYVEFADILTQPFPVSESHGLLIRLQSDLQAARRIVVLEKTTALFLPELGGKGQEHQRILEPLGFMHRDHLDQSGIAFQAHGAMFVLAVGIPQHIRVVVDQGVLAVQLLAFLLQQFSDVQYIRQ